VLLVETPARYQGRSPKRAGRPELGDAPSGTLRMAVWLEPKNEATLRAYSTGSTYPNPEHRETRIER